VQPDNFDPSVITRAPDQTPESERELSQDQEKDFSRLISDLQVEVAGLKAENEKLTAKVDLGPVRQ
jgi:hypothetical protein